MIESIIYSLCSFLYYLFWKIETWSSQKVIDLDLICTKYEMRKWNEQKR